MSEHEHDDALDVSEAEVKALPEAEDEPAAKIAPLPADQLDEDADFESMTDAELEAFNKGLQAEHTRISELQDKLVEVRDRRFNESAASRALEGLSPDALNVLIEAAAAKIEAEAKEPGEG